MAIFDVVVNTDDLVVLGPPDVVDVSISIGEKGDRGATFYAASGNPNSTAISQNIFGSSVTPIAGDLFINTATGDEYGWLYIYNPKIVGNQWDQVLKLQPAIYASKIQTTFTAGISTITIPISDIVQSNVGLTADNFVINLTPHNSDPISTAINSVIINGSNLEISVEAIKYASSAWSSLTGAATFSLTITVI